jgi:hypothetical protein
LVNCIGYSRNCCAGLHVPVMKKHWPYLLLAIPGGLLLFFMWMFLRGSGNASTAPQIVGGSSPGTGPGASGGGGIFGLPSPSFFFGGGGNGGGGGFGGGFGGIGSGIGALASGLGNLTNALSNLFGGNAPVPNFSTTAFASSIGVSPENLPIDPTTVSGFQTTNPDEWSTYINPSSLSTNVPVDTSSNGVPFSDTIDNATFAPQPSYGSFNDSESFNPAGSSDSYDEEASLYDSGGGGGFGD